MTRPEYTPIEKNVMQAMAHGKTREEISAERRVSLSTVARIARDATDKAVAPGAPIVQGIATMVAEGSISVPFRGQRSTAKDTALFWLHTRMMSELNADKLVDIRDAYRAMVDKAGE